MNTTEECQLAIPDVVLSQLSRLQNGGEWKVAVEVMQWGPPRYPVDATMSIEEITGKMRSCRQSAITAARGDQVLREVLSGEPEKRYRMQEIVEEMGKRWPDVTRGHVKGALKRARESGWMNCLASGSGTPALYWVGRANDRV